MLTQLHCTADGIATAEELLCGAVVRTEPDDGQKRSFNDSLDLKASLRADLSLNAKALGQE